MLAALELFAEHGYDSTTVAEIAERAGLTKRTFFRYFTDKREVLFWGQETLSRLFTDAIASAPESAAPIDAISAALVAAQVAFGPERREWVLKRQAVVADNPELQERELLKSAALTAAIADALRERGVEDPAAGLAAEVGNLAFRTAFARWADPGNERGFAELARETLQELRTASSALA